MSKVLYIKANPKSNEESRTFQISEKFVEAYKQSHPQDEIITLDLYQEKIQFLSHEDVNLHKPNQADYHDHPVLKYAYQFLEADRYIIAAPLWNLSIPAILKAYLDYVTWTGITFTYTAEGPKGLCTGKKAVHISARGGQYSEGPAAAFEMGDRYLRTILGFLGITDVTTITAEALDVIGMDVAAVVGKAIEEAKKTAASF